MKARVFVESWVSFVFWFTYLDSNVSSGGFIHSNNPLQGQQLWVGKDMKSLLEYWFILMFWWNLIAQMCFCAIYLTRFCKDFIVFSSLLSPSYFYGLFLCISYSCCLIMCMRKIILHAEYILQWVNNKWAISCNSKKKISKLSRSP